MVHSAIGDVKTIAFGRNPLQSGITESSGELD